jgi:hypothetical protein
VKACRVTDLGFEKEKDGAYLVQAEDFACKWTGAQAS